MGALICVFPKSQTLKVDGKVVACCAAEVLQRDLLDRRLADKLARKKAAWGDEAPDLFVNPENLDELRSKVAADGFVIAYTTAGLTAFNDCAAPYKLGIPVAKLAKVRGRWKLLPLVCEVCGAPATTFIHGPYEDRGGVRFFGRDARRVPVCEEHADRQNYERGLKICNTA